MLMQGDAVLLKDKKPDPAFPAAGEQPHLDMGAHGRIGLFSTDSSVGIFRHEDESFNPYFMEFSTLYPGRYRIRASFWSFGWDKGKVLPARGIEAARLSAVQLTNHGLGGGHPSYVLGYYDAPSLEPKVHEFVTWLNLDETLGFNAASLAHSVNYSRKGRAMAFAGPGVACDWLDVEGPINDVWPPLGHRLLFGDLPIVEFKPAEHAGVRPPVRKPLVKTSTSQRTSTTSSPASGLSKANRRWPMPIACWPASFRRHFVGQSPTTFVRTTWPSLPSASRRAIASRRRCAGSTGQRSARPISSIMWNRPGRSTITRWPAVFPTSSGTRCPTRRCRNWRPPASCTSEKS
jgi:hypothetical protein